MTSELSIAQIELIVRKKAVELLDGPRHAIELRSGDKIYRRLIWTAISEQAMKYAKESMP